MLKTIFGNFVGGRGAYGLLFVRLMFGIALTIHGLPKIQHPFGWMGAQAPVPGFFQALSALAEFFGGIALAAGLLSPLTALIVAINMAVATFSLSKMPVPGGVPFVNNSGGPALETPLGYLAAALLVLLIGPGTLSLDALIFGKKVSEGK